MARQVERNTSGRVVAAKSAARTPKEDATRPVAKTSRIPTMQDIADAAGVSQSTVSRMLTGAPNAIPINPATRSASSPSPARCTTGPILSPADSGAQRRCSSA